MMPDNSPGKKSIMAEIDRINSDPNMSLRQKFDTANNFKQLLGSLLSNQLDFTNKQKLQQESAASQMAIEKARSEAAIQGDIIKGILSGGSDGVGVATPMLMGALTPQQRGLVQPIVEAQQQVKEARQQNLTRGAEQAVVSEAQAVKNLKDIESNANATSFEIFKAQKAATDATAERIRKTGLLDASGFGKSMAAPTIEEANKRAKEIEATVPANFGETPEGKLLQQEDPKFQQQWHSNIAFGKEIETGEKLIAEGDEVGADRFFLAKILKTINSLQSAEAVQTSDMNRYITAIPGMQDKKAAIMNLINSKEPIKDAKDLFSRIGSIMKAGDVNATLELAKLIYDANSAALNETRGGYSRIGGEYYEQRYGKKYIPFKTMGGISKPEEQAQSLGQTSEPASLTAPETQGNAAKKANPAAMSAVLGAFNQTPAPGNTPFRVFGEWETSIGKERLEWVRAASASTMFAN
jgi:hypothetical protein